MARKQTQMLRSDMRRVKRRTTARVLRANAAVVDAIHVLRLAAHDLAVTYSEMGEVELANKATDVCKSLDEARVCTHNGLDLLDILRDFENLPEDWK